MGEDTLERMREALALCQKQRNHWIGMYYEVVKCESSSTGEVFEIKIADDEINKVVKGE